MLIEYWIFCSVGFAAAGEPVQGQNPPPSILNIDPGPRGGQGMSLVATRVLSLSSEYIIYPTAICFWLERQLAMVPFCLALFRAGRSIAARMAMMAITTSNSISVKPRCGRATTGVE